MKKMWLKAICLGVLSLNEPFSCAVSAQSAAARLKTLQDVNNYKNQKMWEEVRSLRTLSNAVDVQRYLEGLVMDGITPYDSILLNAWTANAATWRVPVCPFRNELRQTTTRNYKSTLDLYPKAPRIRKGSAPDPMSRFEAELSVEEIVHLYLRDNGVRERDLPVFVPTVCEALLGRALLAAQVGAQWNAEPLLNAESLNKKTLSAGFLRSLSFPLAYAEDGCDNNLYASFTTAIAWLKARYDYTDTDLGAHTFLLRKQNKAQKLRYAVIQNLGFNIQYAGHRAVLDFLEQQRNTTQSTLTRRIIALYEDWAQTWAQLLSKEILLEDLDLEQQRLFGSFSFRTEVDEDGKVCRADSYFGNVTLKTYLGNSLATRLVHLLEIPVSKDEGKGLHKTICRKFSQRVLPKLMERYKNKTLATDEDALVRAALIPYVARYAITDGKREVLNLLRNYPGLERGEPLERLPFRLAQKVAQSHFGCNPIVFDFCGGSVLGLSPDYHAFLPMHWMVRGQPYHTFYYLWVPTTLAERAWLPEVEQRLRAGLTAEVVDAYNNAPLTHGLARKKALVKAQSQYYERMDRGNEQSAEAAVARMMGWYSWFDPESLATKDNALCKFSFMDPSMSWEFMYVHRPMVCPRISPLPRLEDKNGQLPAPSAADALEFASAQACADIGH